MYLKPESSWEKQDSELNMELYYKDELHLIEKGYKKLADSISEILKDSKKDLHHYPNIAYDQPVIKTNTHFPFLPAKSMLSTNTAYTNNLTTTTLTPRYKYFLLKNIGAAKAKENQMVVTAKSRNEKMNKKISTRTPTFSSLEKHHHHHHHHQQQQQQRQQQQQSQQ